MVIGYARVSSLEQNLDLQLDELRSIGCTKIFQDQITGSKSDRPGITKAIEYCRSGDILVVWRLDRLGRSLKDLLDVVGLLKNRGIELKSLRENIDTCTPGGKLIFHFFAAIAEFERDLIRERTIAGLNAARARGRKGGRPKKMNDSKIKLINELHKSEKYKIKEICEMAGISAPTLYLYLKK